MKLGIYLYILGIYGIILNRKNYILMLISLEILLLGISLIIIIYSIKNDDIIGQIYGLYIIGIAGVESAIGLSILVTYYKLRGSIKGLT